jgi:ketosteroid isomerase-like protein
MPTEQEPITGDENLETLSGLSRALAEFYAAFNGRDLKRMEQSWANTDDVVMDNPVGGITRGWEEIRAVYERIFGGRSRVRVEFHDYTLHEAGEMGYAVGRERGELRRGDEVLRLAIRTTRLFRRIEGRWRQVHHHGSMDDPRLLAQYQEAVGAGRRAATPPS